MIRDHMVEGVIWTRWCLKCTGVTGGKEHKYVLTSMRFICYVTWWSEQTQIMSKRWSQPLTRTHFNALDYYDSQVEVQCILLPENLPSYAGGFCSHWTIKGGGMLEPWVAHGLSMKVLKSHNSSALIMFSAASLSSFCFWVNLFSGLNVRRGSQGCMLLWHSLLCVQWFSITREHALLIVADHLYYNKFKWNCKVKLVPWNTCCCLQVSTEAFKGHRLLYCSTVGMILGMYMSTE